MDRHFLVGCDSRRAGGWPDAAGARDRAETDGRDQAGSVGVGIEQRDVNTG